MIPICARANILYICTHTHVCTHAKHSRTFHSHSCNVFPNSLSRFRPAACASRVLASDIQISGAQANALSRSSVSSQWGAWEARVREERRGGDSQETKQSLAINGDIFHVTLKVNTPSQRRGHMGSFRVGGNKEVSRRWGLTAGRPLT